MPTTNSNANQIRYRRLRNHWHELYSAFTPGLYLRSDEFENQSEGFELEPGYNDLYKGKDTITVIPGGAPQGAVILGEYRAANSDTNPRTDTWLESITMQGNGGTATYHTRGSKQLQRAFAAGRGFATYAGEFGDFDPLTGTSCVASGQLINMFINPLGRGSEIEPGVSDLSFATVTPDVLFHNVALAKQPYLDFQLAEGVRTTMSGMPRTEAALGFVPQGSGPFAGKDPLTNFATFKDTELHPELILAPLPCNEYHLLGRHDSFAIPNVDGCAILYGMWETIRHHCQADRGDGFKKLTQALDFSDIEWSNVLEKKIPEVNLGPASIFEAIAAAADETSGAWRWWFDSLSKFHLIKDYPAYTYADLVPYVFFKSLRSIPGKISVNLGNDRKRLSRQTVHGLFSSAANGAPGIVDHFGTGFGQGVFPLQELNVEGQSARLDGYHGYLVGTQAQYLFSKHSAQTTLTWTDCYDLSLALSMFNRVVSFAFKDPQGAFDWSPGATSPIAIDVGLITHHATTTYDFEGHPHTQEDARYDQYGKRFVCNSVQAVNVGRQKNGDDLFKCTLQFTEIIPLCTDNRPDGRISIEWNS